MVTSTEYFIGNFITSPHVSNHDLFTLGDHYAIYRTGIMCGTGSAPTERLDLEGVYSVAEFYQSGRAGKELRSKISENSKCIDIDAETINNFRQAIYLIGLVELGFIADDVIDSVSRRKMVDNEFMDI
jgi:hypothetical protein